MTLIKLDDAVRAIDDCIEQNTMGGMTLRILCHASLKSGIACPVVEAIPIDELALFLADLEIWPSHADCKNCECYHATCDRVTCWEYVLRGLMKQEDEKT